MLSSILKTLAIYALHIIVRAMVIFFSNLFYRGTRFEIPREQILLSVFGSMKGVNNIVILFFVLNETAREVAFKHHYHQQSSKQLCPLPLSEIQT
jgi:hypothetical protein